MEKISLWEDAIRQWTYLTHIKHSRNINHFYTTSKIACYAKYLSFVPPSTVFIFHTVLCSRIDVDGLIKTPLLSDFPFGLVPGEPGQIWGRKRSFYTLNCIPEPLIQSLSSRKITLPLLVSLPQMVRSLCYWHQNISLSILLSYILPQFTQLKCAIWCFVLFCLLAP